MSPAISPLQSLALHVLASVSCNSAAPDQCFTSPPLILTVTPLAVGILVPFLLARKQAKRLKLLVTGSHWWEAPACSGQKVAFGAKPTGLGPSCLICVQARINHLVL